MLLCASRPCMIKPSVPGCGVVSKAATPQRYVSTCTRRALVPCTRLGLSTRAALSEQTIVAEEDSKRPRALVLLQKIAQGAAIAGLVACLALVSAHPAEAARSGGRIGGSGFSAARSSRSSSSSYSSHAPSSSSRLSSPSYSSGISPGFGLGLGAHSYGYSVMPAPGVGVAIAPRAAYYGGYSVFDTFVTIAALGVLAVTVLPLLTGISKVSTTSASVVGGVQVAKVQVGLLGIAQDMRSSLDRLAATANTDDSEGLHYLLQEIVLALNRNKDFCAYGALTSSMVKDSYAAERAFNAFSLEERSKLEQETLVNVRGGGGPRRRTFTPRDRDRGMNELIVVTLMVAVEGGLQLPPRISSMDDLRKTLIKLGSVPSSKLLAMELIWTPQARDDYFTRDEIASDYPDLIPL